MEKIYVVGHKSPDLDSVAAAVSYANFKNKSEEIEKYLPAVAGSINRETAYALERFGIEKPYYIENADGFNLILVDHNEAAQSPDGVGAAKIVEVLDHHKVDFKYAEPIKFEVVPWGSSNTIIAKKFFEAGIEIEKNLAGLMLSAILVDTVITKSPTCTSVDKEIIEKISGIAGIEDWKSYGMELFKVRSSVKELTTEEIIRSDYKDFILKGGKFGIGQVETVDLSEFDGRDDDIMNKLEIIRNEGGYHSTILFITDIIKEGSKFFVSTSEPEKIEEALNAKFEKGKVFIPGILSRKKQVAPKFSEIFDK